MTDDSMIPLKSETGTSRMSPGEWVRLLALLDPDPDLASRAYLSLHFKLVKLFAWEGVLYAEALADETLNRLARNTTAIRDLPGFVFGIARNVLREYWRDRRRELKPGSPPEKAVSEEEMASLDLALDQLPSEERDLILGYYEEGKPKSIRRDLCARFGLSPNALRLRVYRIKEKLLHRLLKS